MEEDDELERIRVAYSKGEMLTGELKAICIKYLQDYVKAFQDRRSKVTEEVIDHFMEQRKLEFKGNPKAPIVIPTVQEKKEDGAKGAAEDGKLTKNQLKKLEKQKQVEAKKAQKAKEKQAAKETGEAKEAVVPK
jgi:tryptophanyl-tRNA synthetase